MNGFWQGKGGALLKAVVVIGLVVTALAVLIPDRETGDLDGSE